MINRNGKHQYRINGKKNWFFCYVPVSKFADIHENDYLSFFPLTPFVLYQFNNQPFCFFFPNSNTRYFFFFCKNSLYFIAFLMLFVRHPMTITKTTFICSFPLVFHCFSKVIDWFFGGNIYVYKRRKKKIKKQIIS